MKYITMVTPNMEKKILSFDFSTIVIIRIAGDDYNEILETCNYYY